jgi:hypothetical protein
VRACAARGEPLLDCAPAFEAVFGLEGDDWVRKTADTGKCSLPQVSHLQQLVDKTPGATFVLTLRRNAEEWADRITLEETNAIMACREELGLAPYTAEASGPALRRAALREILEAHVQMVNAVFNAAANGARLVVVGDSDSLSTDLHNALGGERACMVQRQSGHAGKIHKRIEAPASHARAPKGEAGKTDAVCWQAQPFTRGPRPRYCVLDDAAYDAERFIAELDEAWARNALWDFLLVTRRRAAGPPKRKGMKDGFTRMDKNGDEWKATMAKYLGLFSRLPVIEAVAGWLCSTDSGQLAVPFGELRTVWYDPKARPVLLRGEHALPPLEAGGLMATRPFVGTDDEAFSCEGHSLVQSLAKHYQQWPQQKGRLSLFLAYWDRPWTSDPEFDDRELRFIKLALSTGLFKRVWWGQKDVDTHGLFETAPQGLSWHYVFGREKQLYEAIRGATLEGKAGVLGAWGVRGTATALSLEARELEEYISSGGGKDVVDRRMVSQEEYYGVLSKYRFMVAPRGGALLSPKYAEALLMLTIPIVKRYACFDDYKAYGWPIVVVDEWDEITVENLERWWTELSPRLLKARWLVTKHGMESLLHGECYEDPPPAAPIATWAQPCSCSEHDECPENNEEYFSPRLKEKYMTNENHEREEWLTRLPYFPPAGITEEMWSRHIAVIAVHQKAEKRVTVHRLFEHFVSMADKSHRVALARNAASPAARRFDKLVVILHFHKAGGTSFNQRFVDAGMLGLTNKQHKTGGGIMANSSGSSGSSSGERRASGRRATTSSAATLNVDNNFYFRQSGIFADPALYTGLFDKGVDFVDFENSFVPLEALDAVRPHIHLVTSIRDPWRRWASTYEREIENGCKRHMREQYLPCMEAMTAASCLEQPLNCSSLSLPALGKIMMLKHPSVLNPNLYNKHIHSRLDAETASFRPVAYGELLQAKRVLASCDLIFTLEPESAAAREAALRAFMRGPVPPARRISNNQLRDGEGQLTDIGARVVGPGAKSAPAPAKERFVALAAADQELYDYGAELAAALGG